MCLHVIGYNFIHDGVFLHLTIHLRLTGRFEKLSVSPTEWFQMSRDQQDAKFKQIFELDQKVFIGRDHDLQLGSPYKLSVNFTGNQISISQCMEWFTFFNSNKVRPT